MKQIEYVLAIDPGGTKCAALLVTADGTLLAQCRLWDWQLGGRHPQLMRRALRQVLGSRRPAPLLIVAIGGRHWRRLCPRPWRPFVRTLCTTEMISVLATTGHSAGLVIVAGTGARVALRPPAGREFYLDALGPLLGDSGSGYFIGREALRAVAREMQLGRPATDLRRKVLAACRCRTLCDLMLFSLQPRDRSLIASLAKIVNEEAEAGDPLARRLLRAGATAMADTVQALVRHCRVARRKLPVVCAGSVVTHSNIYWRELRRHLRRIAPRFQPMRAPLPPVAGLAALGLPTPRATAKLFAALQRKSQP